MAGVIKRRQSDEQAPESDSRLFQFDDISRRADELVETARQQAAQILEEARQEAELIRVRADQEGREAARQVVEEQSRRELHAQLESALPALQAAAQSLVATRQAWLERWESDAVRLACRIASKMVRREVREDPHIPLTLLREALEIAAGQQRVRIQLNPRDFELLENHAREVAQQWSQLCVTEIEPSDAVPPGSCRLKTEHGVIDQRFDVQLQRIEEELLG
jgi:flagellar assembly protein FliH